MLVDSLVKFKSPPRTDSRFKSVLKTLSWRIVGTIDTIVISYFITGNTTMALSIGSVEIVSKMILYYFHERVWQKFSTK